MRCSLSGGELVGDGPARLAAHDSEVTLVVEAVDLYDDAVAAVVEVLPALDPPPAVVERLVGSADEAAVGVRLEAETGEGLDGLPVRVELHRLGVAKGVDVYIEGTFGRGARVELPDGSRGGVARVRVGRETLSDALLVEGLELGFREDDLPANLEAARPRSRDTEGDASDGPHVGGHILADQPVASRRSASEEAVLVGECNGQPIEFELADHVELRFFEEAGNAGVPCQELLVVEGVAQAQEGDGVLGLSEPLKRLRADALGGRVGRDEFGVLGLDCS